VFLDGTKVSPIGIFFGVTSSAITATHSVVIKQSLNVVNGSALALSWYTNLLSAVVLIPLIVLAGETDGIFKLVLGVDELLLKPGEMSILTKFIWGSAITVCVFIYCRICLLAKLLDSGSIGFCDEYRQSVVDQGHLADYTYGLLCCAWCGSLWVGCMAVP